jgi:23S rRNA m(5)U-747 methyltransferase (EC 2.1.1.-)
LEVPYPDQVAAKQAAVERALEEVPGASDIHWLPVRTSAETGFRTRAKMVVGGTAQHPTLGILDAHRHGVDLSDCPVMDPALRAAMPGLALFIQRTGLVPYDVPRRSGELKYVLVTSADDGRLMTRFVLRSRRHLAALRRNLELLRELVPTTRVVTANIHPVHEAIIEGPEEIVLSESATLPMRVGDVVLDPGPRSFSQTNTDVAGDLYRQAARWVDEGGAHSLWDLYCGVGGFALHAARAGVPEVTGVEISEQAIASARQAAGKLPAGSGIRPRTLKAPGVARFVAGDATEWAMGQDEVPDAVVVNPPRRGIGPDLAGWLDRSQVNLVVYSSCNPATLARDLAGMPHLRPEEARLFDMFPHTAHAEVAVRLTRRD